MPRHLFDKANRGLLLDIVVFVANLFFMGLITSRFITIVRYASAGNALAKFAILLFVIGILVLPALGATLKRWHYHQRRGKADSDKSLLSGCLFNPILYFCMNLVIVATVNALLLDFLLGGKDSTNEGSIFIPLTFFGLGFALFQTFLVYRYFSPPKKEPRWEFFRDPRSDFLGDGCIFLNMILFQVIWNLLVVVPFERVHSLGELAGRMFFLSFAALLVYFPPRIFYLAEDIQRRRTWLTMLLANSPVIFRVLIGTNTHSDHW